MAKKPSNKPELKVLDDAQESAQAEKVEQLVSESHEVEKLLPDRDARFEAKSFEPDVDEILPTEEEEVDTEEGWGSSAFKAPPVGWFVLSGLLVVGLAFWASLSVFEAQPELQESVEEKDELEQKRIEEARQVKATLKAMEQAISGYLGAGSVDELVRHVRHPERVRSLVEDYYKTNELKPLAFDHIVRTRSLGLENQSFLRANVKLKDGGIKNLVLQQIGKESFQIDWESDVCHQPMTWDEFRSKRPTSPVLMRMFLKPDHYHVFEFRDEEQFDCYQLTVLCSDEHIYGFAKKGTQVARKLSEYVESNNLTIESKKPQPLMLRIYYPENTHSKKCVVIEEMVQPRWIFVESPGGD